MGKIGERKKIIREIIKLPNISYMTFLVASSIAKKHDPKKAREIDEIIKRTEAKDANHSLSRIEKILKD